MLSDTQQAIDNSDKARRLDTDVSNDNSVAAKKPRNISPELANLCEIDASVVKGSKISQALRMATNSAADEPMGTASIASCMALVLGLISTDKVKAKLLSYLGLKNVEELLSLKDPCRALSALLSPDAKKALSQSPRGALCHQLWEGLGAECIPLEACLENQVNEMLKKVWETDENIFKPYQIVPADKVKDLIAALVSMEKIKVSWTQEFKTYHKDTFTTSSGEKVPAQFCVDSEARSMKNLYFGGARAVLLPCKPDEKTGKERGMIFVLPSEDDQDLDKCLEALAEHAEEKGRGLVFSGCAKYLFSFPAFDAKKDPATIKDWLSKAVPEIFDETAECMEDTLPASIVGGIAYVGDVHHGAMIKADRKGAEAKAVTIATVQIYRSIGSAPEAFCCNRPFISILATLNSDKSGVETIEFVTKHETAKTLDLEVS